MIDIPFEAEAVEAPAEVPDTAVTERSDSEDVATIREKPFDFLALPRQIRDKVYFSMLSLLEETDYRKLSHCFEPAALLVCRQLHTEVSKITYDTLAIRLCIDTECLLWEAP